MAKIPILTSTNVKELSRVNLVLWVNSLNLLDQPIENITQLDDATFFVRLLDFLFPGDVKDLNSSAGGLPLFSFNLPDFDNSEFFLREMFFFENFDYSRWC